MQKGHKTPLKEKLAIAKTASVALFKTHSPTPHRLDTYAKVKQTN